MVIFINDKPLYLLSTKDFWQSEFAKSQRCILDCQDIKKIPLILDGDLTLMNVQKELAVLLLEQIQEDKKVSFMSIVLVADEPEKIEDAIKAQFKVIKASGGLVRKGDKILAMYRLGKWDFPKGKRDSGENSRQTAVREVQEECNVEVRLGKKICTTWHTYSHKGSRILKRTKWYHMICTDDSNMQPQTEEGIELLEWKSPEELINCLENSYQSIRYVAEMAGLQ